MKGHIYRSVKFRGVIAGEMFIYTDVRKNLQNCGLIEALSLTGCSFQWISEEKSVQTQGRKEW